jgi:hypothetical protein
MVEYSVAAVAYADAVSVWVAKANVGGEAAGYFSSYMQRPRKLLMTPNMPGTS